MATEFYKVAEEIEFLNLEDKLYLKELLEKMVIEEKRELIKKKGEESLKEYKEGRIKFGGINDIKKALY